MSSPKRRGELLRVLVDMNTQCDYLLAGGALPVVNRAAVLGNIRELMSWARAQRVPVISSLDSRRPGEPTNGLPAHCVDETAGQRKVPFTLLPRRMFLQADNTFDVPMDPFRRYRQIILTKRTRDFFMNPKADRLVNDLNVHHMIVFGVVTEHCVKAAALGLIARRRRVCVVADACGHWSEQEADLALRQMEAKGALLLTTRELVSGAAEERVAAMPPPVVQVEEDEAAAEAPERVFDEVGGRTRALAEGHCVPPAACHSGEGGEGNGRDRAKGAHPAETSKSPEHGRRPVPGRSSRSWHSPGLA